jgi:hypothetical protein
MKGKKPAKKKQTKPTKYSGPKKDKKDSEYDDRD